MGLSSGFFVDDTGIKLNDLKLKTPSTQLKIKELNLLMSGLSDMKTFEDSVKLDVRIEKSLVSMYDVAYFCTEPKRHGSNGRPPMSGNWKNKTFKNQKIRLIYWYKNQNSRNN